MVQFDVTTGISGSFIDISADIEVDDVVPEEGLIKVLDIVFNDVLVKAQRKRNSFKFQIICQGEFKVSYTISYKTAWVIVTCYSSPLTEPQEHHIFTLMIKIYISNSY